MSAALLHSSRGPVGGATVLDAARRAGVSTGDTLVLHSGLPNIGKPGPGVTRDMLTSSIIAALLECVGSAGSVIFPTFTLSFCNTRRFDVVGTPSEMGVLSEAARHWPGARRTSHPIYSMAVIGPAFERLAQATAATCFGLGSPFAVLHKMAIEGPGTLFFGTMGIKYPPEALTYIHHLEEQARVPYRYNKTFAGTVTDGSGERKVCTEFFVRDLDVPVVFDHEACWSLWRDVGVGESEPLGDSFLFVAREAEVREATISAIQRAPDFLCRGGYRKQYCGTHDSGRQT